MPHTRPHMKVIPLTTRSREARTTNYARHVGKIERKDGLDVATGSGEYVFFGADSPWFENESEWAFWSIPEDVDPRTFTGQLIWRG